MKWVAAYVEVALAKPLSQSFMVCLYSKRWRIDWVVNSIVVNSSANNSVEKLAGGS